MLSRRPMSTGAPMHGMMVLPWRLAVLLALPLLLLAACSGSGDSSGNAPTPTNTVAPTNTPTPSCAAALSGASAINLGAQGFAYPITFPANTVGTTPTQVASGTGLFTVYGFDACSPQTTVSAAQSTLQNGLTNIQHSWITTNIFPYDGGLMKACSFCYWNPKGGPIYYLTFDTFTDHGSGVITYHGEWGVFDIAMLPNCAANSNYTGPAAQNGVFFLPGFTPAVPVPPLSDTVPDDAAGGVRGFDLCSPGTSASITAFLTKELSATGWKQGTSSACIYASECWVQGTAAISWDVSGGPTNWHMAYRAPLG